MWRRKGSSVWRASAYPKTLKKKNKNWGTSITLSKATLWANGPESNNYEGFFLSRYSMLTKSQKNGTLSCKVEKCYIVEMDKYTVMWAVNGWTVFVSSIVSAFWFSTRCQVVMIRYREELNWKSPSLAKGNGFKFLIKKKIASGFRGELHETGCAMLPSTVLLPSNYI